MRRVVRGVRRLSAWFVRAAGAISVLIGLLVLIGWELHIPQLATALPGAVAMKANTALAILLAGAALLLQDPALRGRDTPLKVAMVLGAAVGAIGLASAAEHLLGINFRIDEALAADPSARYATIPGRMSPYSAGSLSCLGLALLLAPLPRWRKPVIALAAAVFIVGVVWLVGYAWGAPELVTDQWLAPVAVHTAAAFILLGAGVVVAAYRSRRRPYSYRMLVDRIQLNLVGSLSAVVLATVVVGGLNYEAAAESAQAAERLRAVRAFRQTLSAFQADTADAVLAQREYLLTGDAAQARRWAAWVAEWPQRRRRLHDAATRWEPQEQALLGTLDQKVEDLRDALDAAVRLYRGPGSDPRSVAAQNGRGTDAFKALRAVAAHVDARERMQAADYEQLLLRGRHRIFFATFLSWLAAAALLGAIVFAIHREMAARATAERRLRRSSASASAAHRFLESVVQNIPHMIFIKDARHLRFELLNRAGEEMIGVPQSRVLGRSDIDLFPPEQAAWFVARDREVLQRGEMLDIPEEEILSAGRGVRVLHTRKIPLGSEPGRPTHLLGISEDVTAARERERQIRSLNEELAARAADVERLAEARSEFLATMSHEIRTPMNGMLGMLELLSLTDLDERQRGVLALVRESGDSLLRIVNDVLDLSKIDAEKLEVHPEVVSVAALLRDICKMHAPLASSRGVAMRSTIDPALSPASSVDAVRLRQILNNFASNAVKFTHSGEVEIRADVVAGSPGAQSVRFSVRDTGPGISPEEQRRLFDPFVQVGQARGGASGGSGLGLVIARRLIELMGGSVRLESVPGVGTTVSFLLDLPDAPPELLPKGLAQRTAELRDAMTQVRAAPHVDQGMEEGTLVLVVDDHPVNRMLLRDQLNMLGYACETAQDGQEALQEWQSGRFGLVLTDCQMPGMDGYELARRIRSEEARHARARIPIIACTAATGELRHIRAAGMDDCLLKPVQLDAMRQKLQEWLPLPAAPGSEARSAVIDVGLIASNWGSDPQTIASIQQAFVASVQEDASTLVEAAARRDLEGVSELAHRMLGASRMVGAQALARACECLQAASREDDATALSQAMQAFERECARVVRELR